MSESYIHPSAVIEDHVTLDKGVKVWHFCHIRSGAHLEEGVNIGKDVYIDLNVKIGRFSRVQNGVSLYQGVKVAPWSFIGPHVIFTNDLSPRSGNKNWKVIETNLKTGMSIGAGAIIRCGVTIGEFAMIGAGAIVTKDVPAFHLATGFPAEITKMVCACGQSFFPLSSSKKNMIAECCQNNLLPETLKLAQELVQT